LLADLGAVVKSNGTGRDAPTNGSHPERAKYVGDPPAFTLTSAQLSEMIERAVAAGVRAASNDAVASELLDRNGIAKVLGCSAAQVDKLRKNGMPCERVGQVPRFKAKACLEWISAQKWEP
jgi:hypothetical protein